VRFGRIYAEGRDAFRSSVPALRRDSVDAPSLWELDEGSRCMGMGMGGTMERAMEREMMA
jgi:hypothetical protein